MLELLLLILVTLCAAALGVLFACWRLRGGRSFSANVARVMGTTDLGGPDGNPPPPP